MKLTNPLKVVALGLFFFFAFFQSNGQTFNYTSGVLNVDVLVSNPCGGSTNGFIKFTVNSAAPGVPTGSVSLQIFGPPSLPIAQVINVGSSFTFNAGQTLPARTYNIIIVDNNGSDIINSFAGDPPVVLTALATIALTDAGTNNLINHSCATPDGKIGFTLTGGSTILAGGGSFNYTITSSNALGNFSGTYNGTGTLDLATAYGLGAGVGLPGGNYSVAITDNYSVCGANKSWIITDPSPAVQAIVTPASSTICAGSNYTVQLDHSEVLPVVYEIMKNGSPTGLNFNGDGSSPFNMTFSTAGFSNSDVITVRAKNGACTPVLMTGSITLTVNPLPTITLGANPSVCSGVTSANLTYSATTGSPNQYSIDFDVTAEAAGFVDVVNAALPATPIVITVPGAAAAATYSAALTVRNSGTGCVSLSSAITVTIIANPTITLGADPSVCRGATSANLTYSATTGSPNQYSIDFNAAANAAGFVDVVNAALPATPIVITVPGAAAAATYNATITVRNSVTGCVSPSSAITVTIIANPTITLGANPSVCSGATSANLTYSATTGSPNQYSIDFNAAANAAGFVDVVNAALPATPIVITVPGAAAAATYNATLTVSNSATGCSSNPSAIAVTIIANPTITLGANPSVCSGVTSANLTYSATTGSPNQYSIDFDATAEAAGFVDVVNAALPATPVVITVPGAAAAATYNATITVRNSGTGCVSPSSAITVTIIANPTITLGADPSVCRGATSANLTYSATTGSPNQYSIDFNAAANAAGFVDVVNAALPATPIVITVPGAAAAATYNATITVRNSVTGCVSPSSAITVTIIANPTITLGANPSVCRGATSANLTYSATTGSPDQYSIDFNAAANAAGFVDVVNAALPATPIVITVPGAAAAATYNATLTVRNSATGCVSPSSAITVTINANPTITLGANPSVCSGATSASLTYSATTGSPNQYSIDFDATAEAAGFVDVVNAALPATPIVITVPGAAAVATYNATLTVRNSGTGCSGNPSAITVTINTNPTITLGANPSVCSGVTSANLTYSATTGSPNQYSIDFNAAANAAGFVDVVNAALPATPIVITVPGAAAAATYNATITVRNSVTGCVSPSSAITVTIIANPTITLGANPSVCRGATSANLTYSATTGSPNQYSIDFNAAANAAGFVDVVNAALPATPIVITVPGAAGAATYNATLTVINSGTGCVSPSSAITVTINPNPTITLGANPSVCSGATSANLTYSATTGSPNQYSIDFDATAEAAGFVDVVNAALPATPIVITVPGAAAVATYNATLTVRNSGTTCVSPSSAITVTIIANPTITLGADPSVCRGATSANLTYSATTGSPDQYSIDFDATAETAGFVDVVNAALPATPIMITVPGAAAASVYNATLTVRNSVAGCSSLGSAITITINTNPTITLGANPSVCSGATSTNLTYTATTGSPDQYSIDFDATAETAGFVDVVNAALPATPIVITVPGAAAAATYNATLTVINSGTGCVSPSSAITVTINPNPTITLGANPSVCSGVTSANLTYSATTGSPNQYSIDFDATAEAAGFVDVVNAALPATPIVITVPGAAAVATYNATLTVRNSGTGCSGNPSAITVTINTNPTITLGANPSVCSGVTSANLTYSATTGSPDQYSIDFDATAETAGFVDVVNAALPATPIMITVPGAAAASAYNATLTVRNSVAGCSSLGSAITITINTNPTITLGANPSVCSGATSTNLTYTATTGSPDQYSIDFDATAETAGFVDVVNAALPATPIVITVPGAAAASVYNATLTVINSGTGCSGNPSAITVTINANPTITLGANPSVCSGATSASLTYSATTGSPDQYSIDFDATAEAAGFVDVVNAALPATPIVITVPGAAAVAIYNATLTVRNGGTTCVSPVSAISVVIDQAPTANAGVDQSICTGSTYTLVGSGVGGAASTGAWSITSQPAGGDGLLSTVTQVANPAVVTFTATVAGDYTLTLTTDDPPGACAAASNDVIVTVTAIPVLVTPQTKTICGNQSVGYEILLNPLNQPANTVFNWPDPDGAGPATAGVNVPMGVAGATHIHDVLTNATSAAITVSYQVTPSVGLCAGSSQSVDITVNPSPVLQTLQTKTICSGEFTGYEILLNPLNQPAGATFSWPDPDGPGSATSRVNVAEGPAGTIHINDQLFNGSASAILVQYSIIPKSSLGCIGATETIDIIVNPGAVVDAGSSQLSCSGGTISLSGASIGGLATTGTWSIVTSPAAGDGVLSLTTATANPAGVTFKATVAGDYVLRLTTDDPAGSCPQISDDATITVRSSNDPLCTGGPGGGGGGNVNCGKFNINVTEVRPSCSNQNDGQISITISGGAPSPNYVLTLYDSIRVPHFTQAVTIAPATTFTFNNLSPSLYYFYKVDDGTTSCTLPYSLQIQTTVAASASGFVDAQCYNQAVGQATITVTSGGASPYSYSLDNGVTWISFTSPYTISNLMPSASPYSILVADDPSDPCPAQVSVTINNAVTDITTSFTATDASCSNNDGTIQVGTVSGGTGPYTFRLDSVDYASLPANNTFTGLAGGIHKFTVIDANGCNKYFKTTINFPGLVNFFSTFTNPDCFGSGTNGSIVATITSSGTFDVGITTDPANDPAVFQTVVSAGGTLVTFDGLSQGSYYVVAKPAGALCPSRSLPIAIGGGPVAVDFNIVPENFVCFETKGMVRIAGIKGSTSVDYNYEIILAGNIIQSGMITPLQALPPDTINYTGLDKGNYQMRLFQDQSVASGCTSPISSSYKSFSINGPAASLDTLYVSRKFSLPNIATGAMLIGIQESQEEPYQLMLHLVTPHLQGQKNNYAFDSTWVSVSRNNQNLIIEFNAINLYGGDYRLSIRDTLGCTRTYDLSLDFDKDIYIPNVFTPNNDGKNDTFEILNLPDKSNLVITNRWGKEVYRSSNYQSNWNGGAEVDGVYYYNLTAGGKVYTGWVEIMHPSY